MSTKKIVASVAIIIALISAIAAAIIIVRGSRNTPVVNVVREWGPSVVNISTESLVPLNQHPYWGQYGGIFDDFYKKSQSMAVGTTKLNGIGSGVVISKEGLIITNAHVINMASRVYVIFSDGKVVTAALAAINPGNDLAILKIEPPKPLKPIRIAKEVTVGETVVSIGNSLGLQNSVSAGIVSGTNRSITNQAVQNAFTGLIQTDASINQGSSGGALLNLDGELVGISLGLVQNAQGIGFAIPYYKIKSIIKDYRDARARQEAK